ncbi:hypothetical protein [Aquimarina sp. AU119]|uniref:hypothetical protein n=1 Tax=Aquimarina sp. AU119 TaxID=2108528 RepID=UPI000D697779|nr:hypothetical protein [Aquimarina sp. AU119]
MKKPTQSEIFTDVKDFVSKFSRFPVHKLKDNFILKSHPLKMNNPQLISMALALRGYVKNFEPNATVLATEIKKSNLTVALLCNLINNKINH